MRRGAATVALFLAALVATVTSRSTAATVGPAAVTSGARAPTPLILSLHPKNPKYLRFRGRATLLVTSGEHYGAVVNRDFDFAGYLRQLSAYRFNLTRLFSGSYVETPNFIQGRGYHNPLAPAPGRRVSIFNFHHALPEAVTANAYLGKPIANDETGFQGGDPFPYRREAWRFVLAGGTVVSNLDWSFAPRYERGTLSTLDFRYGGGGPALRRQLSILKRFVHGFPLLRLVPSPEVASANTEGAVVDVLADPGRAYAVYLSGQPASTLRLLLPAGSYRGTWTSTTTGDAIRRVTFTAGDETVLTVPPYREDVALDLRRNSASS